MSEQISQFNPEAGMGKITPDKAKVPQPVELSPEEDAELVGLLNQAQKAEKTGDKATAVKLLETYRGRYEDLRRKRILEKRGEQGEIGPETLEKNQKMLDFVFGEGRFNLRKEYEEGNIAGLSREQLEIIASQAEDERLSEILIIPGQIERKETIVAVDQKYQELFGQATWYSEQAQADRDQTQAALKNPRPTSFYTIAINPKKETIDAHPETVNQDLFSQLNILKEAQEANPNLNLKGLTLPEGMLLDSYFYANEEDHADAQRGYNRCLEEVTLDKDGNPRRALDLRWPAAFSRLRVLSSLSAGGGLGARFAAVSSPAS